MRRLTVVAVLSVVALVAGCGEYLGDQRFERVRLVTSKPRGSMDVKGSTDLYGRYLEVEFSSETNLTPVGARTSLYVAADLCPIRDRHRIWAFGPYADGKEVADDNGELVERLPGKADDRLYDYVRGPVKALKPNPLDGRYHYTAYLLPSHPMPGIEYSSSSLEMPHYNLATEARDVCLRLFAPGYNLTESRSSTVIIPASTIAAAFATELSWQTEDSARAAELPEANFR